MTDYFHKNIDPPQNGWLWQRIRAGATGSIINGLKLTGDLDMDGNKILNADISGIIPNGTGINQYLNWDVNTNKWIPNTIELNNLQDVYIDNLLFENDILIYENNKWTNRLQSQALKQAYPLSNRSFVITLNTPVENQVKINSLNFVSVSSVSLLVGTNNSGWIEYISGKVGKISDYTDKPFIYITTSKGKVLFKYLNCLGTILVGNVITLMVQYVDKYTFGTSAFVVGEDVNIEWASGDHKLEQHQNVNITNPQNDEVLTYENGKWKNKTGGGGGSTTLASLTDVNLTAPLTDNNGLVYDTATSKWVNKDVILQNGNAYSSDVVVGSTDNNDLQLITNNATKLTVDKQTDPLIWLEGNSGTAKISTRDQIDQPTSGLTLATGSGFDQPIGDLLIQSGSTVDGVAGKIVIQGGNCPAGGVVGSVSNIEIKAGITEDPANPNADGSIQLYTSGTNILEVKPSGLVSSNVSNYKTLVLSNGDLTDKGYVDDKVSASATTASNIGTAGVGVFKSKVLNDLQFKKVNAGSAKITITDDVANNEVDVDLGTVPLDALSDVVITAPVATNEALIYNGTNWVNSAIPTSKSGLLTYRTELIDQTPPPSSGRVKYNNAIQISSTELYVSLTPQSGIDATIILQYFTVGTTFYLQDANDPLNFQIWITNAIPSLNPTYATIYVNLVSSGGTGASNFPNNHAIYLVNVNEGKSLDQLADVNILGVKNLQTIRYDNTTSQYTNQDINELVLVNSQPQDVAITKQTYYFPQVSALYGWANYSIEIPTLNVKPQYTGTEILVGTGTPAGLTAALLTANNGDIITITADIITTTSFTITKNILIRGSSPSIKVSTSSNINTLFTINSPVAGNVMFQSITLEHSNTVSSVATCISVSSANTYLFVDNCTINTNEFGVSNSLGSGFQIENTSFVFVGTNDSHRFIASYNLTAPSFVHSCTFTGNGTFNSQCVFLSAGGSFNNCSLAIQNCTTTNTVQRLLFLEAINWTGTNAQFFLTNNIAQCSSGFAICYAPTYTTGILKVVAYGNTETLGGTATGSKGLWALDNITAVGAINFSNIPQLMFYNNTVPALRVDYADLSFEQDRGIAYNTAIFSATGTKKYSPLTLQYIRTNLSNLDDVNIQSLTNNEVLKYNSSTQKWENGTVSLNLDQLGQTLISNPPNNGDILIYNSTLTKWINDANNLNRLSDVIITGTPTNRQILQYNSTSTQWENTDPLFISTDGINTLRNPASNNLGTSTNSAILAGASHIVDGNWNAILSGNGNNILLNTTINSVVCGGVSNSLSNSTSVIVGGELNDCQSITSFIGGGYNNITSGQSSVIVGGVNNQATNLGSVVVSGSGNLASGAYAFIGNGQGNIASGDRAIVCGGSSNLASGQLSMILGGSNHQATAIGCTIIGGNNCRATNSWAGTICGVENKATGDSSIALSGQFNESNGDGGFVSGIQCKGGVGISTANARCATVLNGQGNIIDESGGSAIYSTIINGTSNTIYASKYSLAYGQSSYVDASNFACLFNLDESSGLTVSGRNSSFTINFNPLEPSRGLYLPNTEVLAGTPVNYDATTGRIVFNASSERFKQEIKDVDEDTMNRLMKCRPVSFKWKSNDKQDYGFIAEEVERELPVVVEKDKEDKPYSLRYDSFIPLLLKKIQQLEERIKVLEAR